MRMGGLTNYYLEINFTALILGERNSIFGGRVEASILCLPGSWNWA